MCSLISAEASGSFLSNFTANSSALVSLHPPLSEGIRTRLVLVFPGQRIEQELDDRVERVQDELEEHETNDDGLRRGRREAWVEPERGEEGLVVDEDGEHGECEEEVGLSDEQKLGRMGFPVVSRARR